MVLSYDILKGSKVLGNIRKFMGIFLKFFKSIVNTILPSRGILVVEELEKVSDLFFTCSVTFNGGVGTGGPISPIVPAAC